MSNGMDEFTVGLAERERQRIYGKYRGKVTNIDDPETLGRVKALVPAVYGEQESPWAMPAFPFAGNRHGLVLLPEVDDGIWIEFEGGDISRPIWSGGWFASGERPQPDGSRARVLITSAGHQVVLDEDDDVIRLKHPGGAELTLGANDIILKFGQCELKVTQSEINLNNGMVKVTTAGASLVNDAFKVGA